MATLSLNPIRLSTLALGAALALAPPALAGDVSVKLDASTGFVIENSTGAIERLRVDEATGNVSRNGALFVHTTGTNNLFVGAGAGNPATTGYGGSTAVGNHALNYNTTGFSNSAFGNRALRFNTTGSSNSAVGSYALYLHTTGSRNVAVGTYAGWNHLTGSDNIYLANLGLAAESGRIRIGTHLAHTATFIAGIHGSNVGTSALPVFVNTSGQLGTGGVPQAPWTANLDAATFDLTNVGGIDFDPVVGGTESSRWITGTQSETGFGWRLGIVPGRFDTFSGLTPDTRFVRAFNYNALGEIDSPFMHAIGLDDEAAYFQNSSTGYGMWYENLVNAYRARSTTVLDNKSGGFDLTAGEMITVREPTNGAVLATGEVRSWDGTTVDIIWLAPVKSVVASDDPASGDALETASTTTVTARTGTFNDMTLVWVYASGQPCGTDEVGADATFFIRSIQAQAGTTADLTIVQTRGLGTHLAAGRCILQQATGATATLGTVTKGDTALLGALTHAQDFWGPGPRFNVDLTHQYVDWELATSALAQSDGRAFRVRATRDAAQVPYGGFNFTGTFPGTTDTMFSFGDDGTLDGGRTYNHLAVAFHGPLKVWRNTDSFSYHILKPADGTGNLNHFLPPVDGTLPALDLTGCDAGDPIVASDGVGGVECGTPVAVGGGNLASTLASVAEEIPFVTDTSGDAVADSSVGFQRRLPPLGASATRRGRIDVTGDSDRSSSKLILTTAAAAPNRTGEFTHSLARLSKAVASGGGRGPVVGAVSNGGTFDTPEELCDLSYGSADGVTQACVSGSAKKFGMSAPANHVHLIGCGETVGSGVYFEVVCTVE